MEVSTKATEVTSSNLGTFNVIAASGAAGSQSQVWSTTASQVGSTAVWTTDKYWPSTDQGYTSFYASNAVLTFNAAGPTVSPADNSVDVVVAHNSSPTYREQNSLEFEHIYARVRNIVLNTQSGYELSAVSASLQSPVTGGTYNLRTNAWTPGAASANQAMGAFSGTTSAQTSTNDYWLVPGDYTLSVSYTLTKGDYQESFTKTGTVTLLQCCNNTITATAVGGSASEIVFGVSVFPWNSNEIIMDWLPTFAGLQIAPGPLYYNGSSYEIKDNWNYSSYESVYGKASGSTHFNFIEMGQLFEKAGFSYSDGDIENLLNPLSGWRLPTKADWVAITINTSARAGSTVNSSAGKHYALIKLTGVSHAGTTTPNGLLIFPDGQSITGKALSGMDNTTQTTGVTVAELNAYLSQGCVFLPASGYYNKEADDWESSGSYLSSTLDSTEDEADLFYFDYYRLMMYVNTDSSLFYYPIRLVK